MILFIVDTCKFLENGYFFGILLFESSLKLLIFSLIFLNEFYFYIFLYKKDNQH